MNTKWFLIFLLSVLVYGANFWSPTIYILDESKNAGCAMEMFQRGDLIVPTFNGELRTDKPPLHYFFMMLAYSVFGINAFAARLFSVLAGVLLIQILYQFIKTHFNEGCAFAASLIMLSSMQLAVQFHLAVPDPYLILIVTAALLFFYEGFVVGSRKKLYAFYVAIALGFLTKGLVAIVLPGAIIFLYMLVQRQFTWKSIGKLHLPIGIIIFCLLALPWYVAVGYQTQGLWLEGFFLKHNLERYTSTMEGHRGFFLTPFLILIVGLLPFSFFVVQSVGYTWRLQKEKPFILLCLITILVIPAFFAFSKTILPSYPAPALPFLAVLIGIYWSEKFLPGTDRKWHELLALILYTLVSFAIPVGVYVALLKELPEYNLEYLSVYFIALPVGALLSLYFFLSRRKIYLMRVLSASWIVTSVLFFYVCFPQVDKINPVSQSLPLLYDQKVAFYGDLNPAYILALKSTVKELNSSAEVDLFLKNEGFVITQQKYIPELPSVLDADILFRQKDLFENPTTIILARKLLP